MIIDEILKITPEWLKKPTVIKVFKAVGAYWDMLYDKMMYVRRMSIAATSEDKWLELIGSGKNLPRLAGETIEQYRGRVVDGRRFWREIGSVRGLLKWLEAAGYPATIVEYVLEADKLTDNERLMGQDALDGSGDLSLPVEIDADRLYRWAEFEVEVDIGSETFGSAIQKYLYSLINLARRASKRFVLFYFKESLEFELTTAFWCLYQLLGNYHVQGGFGEYLDGQGTIVDSPLVPYTWAESSYLMSIYLGFPARGEFLETLDHGGYLFFLDGSGLLGSGGLLDGSDTLDGSGDLSYPSLHPGYKYILNDDTAPLVDQAAAPTIETAIYSECVWPH